MKIQKNEKGQAMAPQTQHIGAKAFEQIGYTEIRWLGGGGAMINSRGTRLMIDPLLEGFDMPLLIEQPIQPQEIPGLEAILVTHIDNDHFSRMTCRDLKPVCREYHAPQYVAGEMKKEGLDGIGHDIGDCFQIGDIKVTLTSADHSWQAGIPEFADHEWKQEDCCGYWLETLDGTIWMPGDSRLMEGQLHMSQPDVILFDFSDNDWHITLDGAIKLANVYPEAQLICVHWGSVDAPEMTPFNGNPEDLVEKVVNPERIRVLAPGEVLRLG